MAIGALVTIKIKEGANDAFEAVARELTAAVKANEPGTLVYQFCRSKTDPTTYTVMEVYADQAALDAHGKTEHFKRLGPQMGPSMAGRPEVQFLETV